MRRTSSAMRQAGGAVLWVIVAVALAVAAYYGYKAFGIYRENVAPAVAGVAKLASAVKSVVPSITPTRDPDEVAKTLQSAFRIAPPDGYVGAFGFTLEVLGRKSTQLIALIPEGVPASEIFEGGRGEVRFNPGPHTIFLAGKFDRATRDEMREGIAAMVGGDAQSDPFKPVYIEVAGRRVAAYIGTVRNYGASNKAVFVFMDEGRTFHAVGPAAAFDEPALARALAALVAAHPANELLYEHPKLEATRAPGTDPCGIRGLAGDYDVVVVSVSRGSVPLDVALDKSGNDVAREDVVVGVTPKPVVLVLMGRDPIVWNVGQTQGARIAGILAEGVYRQAVIGVPKATPMALYSTSDGPNSCQYFRAERAIGREYDAANRRIRELFGRDIGTFLNRKAGGQFVVGEVSGEPMYAPDLTLARVALPDSVVPGGLRGVERLEKQKAIRRATDEDIDRWVAGAARRVGQPVDAYRRKFSSRLYKDSVYVVLQEFELPNGLAGAHAQTFIIPAGTPKPTGPKGHNTFLEMDAFQCYGVGCY